MCPFRETFPLHLTEPTHAGTLRTLGTLLFQFAHEWPFFPPHAEPVIAVELRAVATDLRYLVVFLSETVPANAAQVAALAAEIEAAMGPPEDRSS